METNILTSCLIVPDWPAAKSIRAYCTTRKGGGSQAPYHSLNLATHVGDAPVAVEENRQQLTRALSLPNSPLWMAQQHTTKLLYMPEYSGVDGVQNVPVADACWSDRSGDVCAVLTADCMPILLCDQQGSWVAAIHAGWKGLLDGIVQKSLQQILVQKETPAEAVLAWIGPAISQAHFEVGVEVQRAFTLAYPENAVFFRPNPINQSRFFADLSGIAEALLRQKGVQQITQSALCTYANPQQFFSYRYACHHPEIETEAGKTGRMASLIWRV
ncbi:MAG: peptidoglycan editing factor PgeF [Thiotrichales bacterium]|nr:peptidoglycan editing factor PgeF [Thiotrichales bacterium]